RAQSTFLYRLVQKLPFKVLLSLRDYVLDKLSKPKQYAKNTEHRQKENNSVRETTGDTNWG
ncbi:hypothetical protein ACO1KT_14950, partial [Staphylococcus aureus]